MAICSYLGTQVRHFVATCPEYHAQYTPSLLHEEWDIDAQEEYTSCYGRFLDDNFSPGTINCKLQPFTATGEMQLWMVALPGVRILPGEVLCAAYGKNYWLDHLPTLSPDTRQRCVSKYKYKPSEFLNDGLNPCGAHPSPTPFILLPFLCTSPRQVNSTLRLHSLAQPSSPRLANDPSLPRSEKLSLLRSYFLTEPVLQLHR